MGEIINKSKGRIKQAVGDLTDNKELKQEGREDEIKGKVEGAVQHLKDAATSVKKAVKGIVK